MFESMGALTWVMKCEAEAPPPPPSKFRHLLSAPLDARRPGAAARRH